jgi:hypothetical protein
MTRGINNPKVTSIVENSLLKKPYIGDKEVAPKHTVDNRYLLSGYRCNYDSVSLALSILLFNTINVIESLFHCHNETCNIWTHLVPCFLLILCFIYMKIY